MPAKEKQKRRLLYRYDRFDDGSIALTRPYKKGFRDDLTLLKFDCLAFEQDLSKLPEPMRRRYLAFERAYIAFYRLWTGSGAGNLSTDLSQALDTVQRDFESFRAKLTDALEPPLDDIYTSEEYSPYQVNKAADNLNWGVPEESDSPVT